MTKFLSLGLGVQSTCLYFMSSMGVLPRVNAAIFADLGREKAGTLRYLDYLLNWMNENGGIPITVIRNKNLYQDLLNNVNSRERRFSSIPAFTRNEDGSQGMLRRQCTGEYKIDQVDTAIRKYFKKDNLRGYQVEVWKGISRDELDRMSEPDVQWKTHTYPFTHYRVSAKEYTRYDPGIPTMTRNDIENWFRQHNLPIPPKSSCVFCPYQSDASYAYMQENEPENFEAACLVDDAIRNSSKKGTGQPVYLHESMIPLREVVFKKGRPDLWHGDCSGGCHT